jgi:anti-sigma factor RsiW
MNHDPEQWAAAYLEGLSEQDRAAFEEHLLDCEACWQEVSLARTGRALAESTHDRAPAGLRETIRATVATAATGPGPRTGGRGLAGALATVAAVLVLIGGLAVWRPWQQPTPDTTAAASSAVAEAVASFRQDRLPGTTVPAQRAPDLGALGLRLVGAATGTIHDTPVTVFAYRGDTGRRLDIYRSARPIPEAGEAHGVRGDEDAWSTKIDGLTVICGPATHTVLVIGSEPGLVNQAGQLLDLL